MNQTDVVQDDTAQNREKTRPLHGEPSSMRLRSGLAITLIGLFVFTVGAKPNWFGWDRSPAVGFIQIAVFLIGLALICLGGFVGLTALWGKEQRSIIADIGLRLVGTGYVITIFTGMADVFARFAQDHLFGLRPIEHHDEDGVRILRNVEGARRGFPT